MESELFGYAKGAFTGAHNQKLGLLDAANGGTAFFDEIGELPLEMQMKLLRVLQEKEFRAVGGMVQRSSNFRVIAATNRDLAKEVEAGRFRQDLYFRLNVMRLRLAPLRERRDDIPALVAHFLEKYGNGHNDGHGSDRSAPGVRMAGKHPRTGAHGSADGRDELRAVDHSRGSAVHRGQPIAGAAIRSGAGAGRFRSVSALPSSPSPSDGPRRAMRSFLWQKWKSAPFCTRSTTARAIGR